MSFPGAQDFDKLMQPYPNYAEITAVPGGEGTSFKRSRPATTIDEAFDDIDEAEITTNTPGKLTGDLTSLPFILRGPIPKAGSESDYKFLPGQLVFLRSSYPPTAPQPRSIANGISLIPLPPRGEVSGYSSGHPSAFPISRGGWGTGDDVDCIITMQRLNVVLADRMDYFNCAEKVMATWRFVGMVQNIDDREGSHRKVNVITDGGEVSIRNCLGSHVQAGCRLYLVLRREALVNRAGTNIYPLQFVPYAGNYNQIVPPHVVCYKELATSPVNPGETRQHDPILFGVAMWGSEGNVDKRYLGYGISQYGGKNGGHGANNDVSALLQLPFIKIHMCV